MLYFAYGSNLYLNRFEWRVGNVVKVKNYSLADYKLVFNVGDKYRAFANIEYSLGERVEGVIYDITKKQEADLDKYEGVKEQCYKKVWFPIEGKPVLCYMGLKPSIASPDLTYLGYIYKGAKHHDLKNLQNRVGQLIKEVYPNDFNKFIKYIEQHELRKLY